MPTKLLDSNPALVKAVQTYLARQARRAHPDGFFDNAKRWYPSDDERCDCCDATRSPSRAWPQSLNKHCRSAQHIANLFCVDVTELRRAIRAANETAA